VLPASDDIIDIASESDESGKTPGTDCARASDAASADGEGTQPGSSDPADARLLELLASDLTDDQPRRGPGTAAQAPGDDEARAPYVVDRATMRRPG